VSINFMGGVLGADEGSTKATEAAKMTLPHQRHRRCEMHMCPRSPALHMRLVECLAK
jgi:hypothetical protein